MCLGPTHAIGAAAAATVVSLTIWHPSTPALAAGILLTAGAGLANDIDHPHSTVTDELGPITAVLSWLVRKMTGGAPRRTHSIPCILAATGLAWGQVAWYRHGPFPGEPAGHGISLAARVLLVFTLTVLISAAVRALGDPFTHADRELGKVLAVVSDFGGVVAGVVMVLTGFGVQLLVPAVAFGMTVHVIMDSLTTEGCPWFYPFTTRNFWILGKHGPHFHTGHGFEKVFAGVLGTGLVYLLFIRGGAHLPGYLTVRDWGRT